MTEPAWLGVARSNIGVTEIPGPRHNSKILGWLQKLRAWWSDDETPWCGVFVAHCMQESGLPLPRFWMRATDWLNWGAKLAAPVAGCVVVFQRPGGGHVGFVVGRDKAGNLMVLGGNQGNAVNVRAFSVGRVVGYRWPAGLPVPANDNLPLLASDGKLSANEA